MLEHFDSMRDAKEFFVIVKNITIKNFGPVKFIFLDLEQQYNVLIGAQATGKSTVAKCVAFFSNLSLYFGERVVRKARGNSYLRGHDYISFLQDAIREEFLAAFCEKNIDKDTYIRCDYGGDAYIEIRFVEKVLLTKISNVLEDKLLKVFEGNFDSSCVRERSDVAYGSFAIKSMVEDMKEVFREKEVSYIPAGRNTLSAMININVYTKEAIGSPDFAIANFLKHVMHCKNNWNNFGKWGFGKPFNNDEENEKLRNQIKKFDEISGKILKGKYTQKREEDFLAIKGGKNIPITFASSGQQEVLWLINIMKMYLLERTQVLLIIEEPEAHLYPDAQLELIKLVALVANCTGGKVFVTTHSPYILSSFNLLLHSGYVENNDKVKAGAKKAILDADFRINPGCLLANKIEDTGEVVSLISGERRMVDILAIDGVSEKINACTDKLISQEIKYDL